MHALARRVDDHLVAGPHLSARYRAAIAAEDEMRAVHPLHGKAEWTAPAGGRDVHGLEMPKQRRSVVPMHVRAGAQHVVALERRNRNAGHLLEAERLREAHEILDDLVEERLIEIDQV